jgi:hypothetical protein
MFKFYKVMRVPVLMYAAERCAVNKADRRAVEAAEMKCLRHVAGSTPEKEARRGSTKTRTCFARDPRGCALHTSRPANGRRAVCKTLI